MNFPRIPLKSLLRSCLPFCALLATGVAAEPLRIAVTNDDGWNSTGIRALDTAFRKAGHIVTVVGPLTQQSGSSAAINTSGIRVRREADRIYSAAAGAEEGSEPLVAGMLALEIATALDGAPPNWLVSGINQGANLGNATQHSGTVGAVIGALGGSFTTPVPGIAISTDEPRCGTAACDTATIEAHYAAVADFVNRLISALPAALPPGTGLNINYPALPAAQVKGVRIVRQGSGFPIGGRQLRMRYACPQCASIATGESAEVSLAPVPDPVVAAQGTDSAAFAEGYITIVPIQGDHTVNEFTTARQQLESLTALRP